MLILTCILILKYGGRKYKRLTIFLIIVIIFLLGFLIRNIYKYFENRNQNNNGEWINIQEFFDILQMDKEGKLQSYTEITLLSDIDGEILNLNVNIGDIVDEYQILMQIKNINLISSDYDDVREMIETMHENKDELSKKYEEFQRENGNEMKKLEKSLYNSQNAIIQAIEFNDLESKNQLEKTIQENSEKLRLLKSQKEELENGIRNLESQIGLVRNETDKYYYETEKQTPRSPYKGVVGNIYVNEGESVKNGDKLITIINNNFSPEIFVDLDFNEYVLIKDLTGVTIFIENENRGDSYYEGEIYSRSPILNNEGKYTITVKILEDDISDLILSDENTNIKVIFTINSNLLWLPDDCFIKIGNNNGVVTLRDGDLLEKKEIGIKYKWNGWNNVENFVFLSLEKEEKKDGIELCIEDWNKGVIKENDVDIIDWYNQFENVEDFCTEFIKVNPMYGENRNLTIVPDLGGDSDIVEILCKIE